MLYALFVDLKSIEKYKISQTKPNNPITQPLYPYLLHLLAITFLLQLLLPLLPLISFHLLPILFHILPLLHINHVHLKSYSLHLPILGFAFELLRHLLLLGLVLACLILVLC